MADESYAFVVASNRLPVDLVADEAGGFGWKPSPGGLVTAIEPVMRGTDGAWVGWVGQADLDVAPFDHEGVRNVPVPHAAEELET